MLNDTKLRLEEARKELLDFTLRNPLLNHRKKAKQVPIIDEKSSYVLDSLVNKNKTMSFDALSDDSATALEAGEALPVKENLEPDENGFLPHHKDNKLQSALNEEKLRKALMSISHDARTYIEEQGVNILYLVLGFLHWYETPSATEPRRAPLVLIPVSVSRRSAKEKFTISYTGEDLGDNLSLAAKLKAEYGVVLPTIESDEDFDLADFFAKTEEAVSKYSNWKVERDEMTLAFFSFGKFLMYKDLDPDKWANDATPVIDYVLAEGFKDNQDGLPDDTKIDELVFPEDSFQIRDADSSQVLALLDANEGRNMVIQGPPGTGKSQTITNIIAESIGRGKTVLFVSEKMAALEVVKKRLDEVGIGDAVLELHSYKTNKKQVLSELNKTLSLGKPVLNTDTYEARDYLTARAALNEYCEAVNKNIEGTSLSFAEALGVQTKLETPEIKSLNYPKLELSEDAYRKSRNHVQEIGKLINDKGMPSENPFFGTAYTSVTPDFKRKITELATSYELKAQEAVKQAAFFMDYSENPLEFDEVEKIILTAEKLASAPDLSTLDTTSNLWIDSQQEVRDFIEKSQAVQETKSKYKDKVIDDIWNHDLVEQRRAIASKGGSFLRVLSGDYRKAESFVKGFFKAGVSMSADEILSLLDCVSEVREAQRSVGLVADKIKPIFKSGSDVNTADYYLDLYKLNSAVAKVVAGDKVPDFIEHGKKLKSVTAELESIGKAYFTELNMTPRTFETMDAVRDYAESAVRSIDLLDHAAYYAYAATQLKEEGLQNIMEIASIWDKDGDTFVKSFDYYWHKALTDKAFSDVPAIAHFNSSIHSARIDTFNRTDKLILEKNRSKVALKHWERIPRTAANGEVNIIRREINKKKMHMPIRRLLAEAGRAIQAMKPVFMMSPLSIATYIPEGSLKFDMVIFDEASQVKPVDAFGAIMRGSQAVVVGDSKQLPPTSFFDRIGTESEDEENYDSLGVMESILSLFCAKGAWERMLRWHYRSRHESLITISNEKFYDGRLVVFPSPGFNIDGMGLKMTHSPETVYDRGKTRTNIKEAEIVAKAVMEHAKQKPDLSLGVVAFSTSQRDAIEEQLEILRREDNSCEDFFSEGRYEAFFIKNLENVQGDERDVIFISIGYGRTEDGQFAMSFGPLTAQGGERRLNVLISRAKRAMQVFANFRSNELDLSRTNSVGVAALKAFMEYAETGKVAQASSSGASLPKFEEAVAQALKAKGLNVATSIGTSIFRMDIGVVDSENSGKYSLGICCDADSYAAALSARDRDRTRNEVLKGLGWKLHRVWSTDWYRSKEQELEKVLKALHNEEPKPKKEEAPKAQPIEIVRDEIVTAVQTDVPLYQVHNVNIALRGKDFTELNFQDFRPYILDILKYESPIHIELLTKRLRTGAGITKSTAKIVNHIRSIVKTSAGMGILKQKDDFVWLNDMAEPTVKNRAELDTQDRKIEYISSEELRIALMTAVRGAFTLSEDDAITLAGKSMGFARITPNVQTALREELETLKKEGLLASGDGRVSLVG
jgi:hypothetical protein